MSTRNRRQWVVGHMGIASSLFLILAATSARGDISTVQVASGLSSPVYVTAPGGDGNRLFIVEQGSGGTARIKILNLPSHTLEATPFLTISGIATGGEQGLLGLAFDPGYFTNGRFYVNYTATGGAFGAGVTHVAQYTVSANPNVANAASALDILTFDQPQTNHNGGWIGFSNRPGDTGNLYIATGDGGNGDDTGTGHTPGIGNAQDSNRLLGKILRITPAVGAGPVAHPNYTAPAGNRFAAGGGAPEVWLYGLRNPFRNSFDRATGNFLIGDVGQGSREEVDFQAASDPNGGQNYGWRVREGRVQNPAYPADPTPAGAVDPIYDYTRTGPNGGRVIIGGYVYRGTLAPDLYGSYIFADELGTSADGNTQIFSIPGNGSSTATNLATNLSAALDPTGPARFLNISSFGEDAAGELYIVDLTAGAVYQIVPEPASLAILALGGLALRLRRRRQARCQP